MNKYLILLLIIFIVHSCKGQKDDANFKTEKKQDKILQEHTFLKVTDNSSNKILFKPCGAEIEVYKFYKDSIYHNWGQEVDIINKLQIFYKNNHILYKGFNSNTKKEEIINIEKVSPYYWKINGELFIDSIYKSKIILKKENNCNDTEDNNIVNLKSHSPDGVWKTNCGSGLGSLTIKNKNASLIVLFNQIYIEIEEVKRYDFENGIAYKLKQIPEDLGTYGIQLDWNEYINDKPIAYIKIVDENTLKFYWYGFYNNKSKKREMTECQFNQEQNISSEEIILKKCDE